MSDQQSQDQTVTCPNKNTQNSSLDQARFISLEELESTPSTKKVPPCATTKSCMKKIRVQEEPDSEEWRRVLTKSVQRFNMQTPSKEEDKQVNKEEKTQQAKIRSTAKYEKSCPICLCQYPSVRGSLDCHHEFCLSCIQKWCESATVCPCCRKQFTSILKMVRDEADNHIKQTSRIPVEKKMLVVETQYDHYLCYQCGSGQDEHVLLICDQCDFYCCHVYCDHDLDGVMPSGNWYCIYCRCSRRQRGRRRTTYTSLAQMQLRELQQTSRRQGSHSSGVSSRTRSHQLIGPLIGRSHIVPRNTNTLLRQVRRQVQ